MHHIVSVRPVVAPTIFMAIIDSTVNIMQVGPIVLLMISISRLLRGR